MGRRGNKTRRDRRRVRNEREAVKRAEEVASSPSRKRGRWFLGVARGGTTVEFVSSGVPVPWPDQDAPDPHLREKTAWAQAGFPHLGEG